jgi:hypothetical protein
MDRNETEQSQRQNRQLKVILAVAGMLGTFGAGLIVADLSLRNTDVARWIQGRERVTLDELRGGKWFENRGRRTYLRFNSDGTISCNVKASGEYTVGSFSYDGKYLTLDYGMMKVTGTMTWIARPNLVLFKAGGDPNLWERVP